MDVCEGRKSEVGYDPKQIDGKVCHGEATIHRDKLDAKRDVMY